MKYANLKEAERDIRNLSLTIDMTVEMFDQERSTNEVIKGGVDLNECYTNVCFPLTQVTSLHRLEKGHQHQHY